MPCSTTTMLSSGENQTDESAANAVSPSTTAIRVGSIRLILSTSLGSSTPDEQVLKAYPTACSLHIPNEAGHDTGGIDAGRHWDGAGDSWRSVGQVWHSAGQSGASVQPLYRTTTS